MDMLLLKILTELRSFGFSLAQLKRVKASLEEQYVHRPSSGEKTTLWEYHVALALAARKPTYLLVFRDGTAEPTYFEQYYASLKHIALADHVHININPLLQLLFPKAAREPLYDQTTEVGADELEALLLIRTGNYESVTVKLKNGEIERFEVDEPVNVEKRIVDILQEEGYQNIQIEQTDGKAVSIKREGFE